MRTDRTTISVLHILISGGWHAQTAAAAKLIEYEAARYHVDTSIVVLSESKAYRYFRDRKIDTYTIKYHGDPNLIFLVNGLLKTGEIYEK